MVGVMIEDLYFNFEYLLYLFHLNKKSHEKVNLKSDFNENSVKNVKPTGIFPVNGKNY